MMMQLSRFALCFLVLLAICLSTPAKADSKGETSLGVTVLASSSLTDALTEISRIYAKRKGVTASMFFGAPAELAEAIENGESADVYISEDTNAFTSLKQKGLIDGYTVANLAKNRMALCVPSDSHLLRQFTPPAPLEKVLPRFNERSILVLPDADTVPLGIYAKQVFQSMGYWKMLQSVLLRAENDRRALYLVAKGKNSGVVYVSDTTKNPEVVILSYFPEKSHPPIIYQGAVVVGLNMPRAREFLDFLKTKEAKNVFKKHGFLEP